MQTNLTEIFLQIAGSLEATGSPESYIRHIQAEHKRITALYLKKTGKKPASRIPSHLTDEYLDRMIKNWNVLSKPLGLNAFAREIGNFTREGIIGTRLTGTVAVEVFNQHQEKVLASMTGETSAAVGFGELRKGLEETLELNRENVSSAGYENSRRDAVSYASIIKDRFQKMFRKIDAAAKPDKAAPMKEAILGVFVDLGYLAETELELGILESAAKRL